MGVYGADGRAGCLRGVASGEVLAGLFGGCDGVKDCGGRGWGGVGWGVWREGERGGVRLLRVAGLDGRLIWRGEADHDDRPRFFLSLLVDKLSSMMVIKCAVRHSNE